MSLSRPPIGDDRPSLARAASSFTKANCGPPPISSPLFKDEKCSPADAILELGDGSTFRGIGFGAEGKSVAGECVFQTGKSTGRSMADVFISLSRYGGIHRIVDRPIL